MVDPGRSKDLAGAQSARQIGIDDARPLGFVFFQRRCLRRNAGSIDEDVDLAEGLQNCVVESLYRFPALHIARCVQRAAPKRLDLRGYFDDLFSPPRSGYHVCTGASQS
jgi:hypothetical protein